MAWWNLPIRSGRLSASGTAFWYDRPNDPISATARLDAEEQDVALIDAMCGSSVKSDRTNVQTWARLIGDPVGVPIATGALNSVDTQFDWRPTTFFGFGQAVDHLPTGGVYATDGSGWLIWTSQSIPSDEATSQASSPIWAAIIAGTHDAKYVKFGERVVTKMATTGHPLKRLIIDFNHEMNQSNDFQIWAGNLTEYKQAMERTITKIREGADNITPGAGAILKFMHRPAYRVDQGATKIGAYNSFIPTGIDVLALSIHPDGSCNSAAAVDALFAGTLNAQWYGTDELIATATAMGLPIAFPEWSPIFQTLSANGGACPAADTFVQKFFAQVIEPNRARLVCDCIWHQNVRDKTAYTATDAEGIAQWSAMVDTRKSLWNGIQSDDSVPSTDSFTYTVTDDWGQRTASVAVTIQGGSVLFLNANEDSASTAPGTAVVIPVLDNDQASPTLLPLVIQPGSVTNPSPSGTATITTGNEVRYTPASGAQNLEATFSYTAKPQSAASPTGTALVRVQITGGTPPTGDFPALGGNQRFDVTSAGQFSSMYGQASSGDHVVVANNVTLSNPTLNRTGVVVRAATNQGATISGTVTMAASNQWIYGFQAVRFEINSGVNNLTFRRMHFNGYSGSTYISRIWQSNDTKFSYCTLSNSSGGGFRYESPCRSGTVEFCHWYNITGTANGNEPLGINAGYQTQLIAGGFLVTDCLFENCNYPSGAENETISVKSGGNIIRRVQFDRCRELSLRFGNNNQVLGCWVPASTNVSIGVRGRDHIINNCLGTINLRDGTWSSANNTLPSASMFPNAVDARVIGGGLPSQAGADSQIGIGQYGQSVDCVGARIEGRGSSPNVVNQQGGRNNPVIVSNTSVTLIDRPNFPLGQQANNTQVGVRGGL